MATDEGFIACILHDFSACSQPIVQKVHVWMTKNVVKSQNVNKVQVQVQEKVVVVTSTTV